MHSTPHLQHTSQHGNRSGEDPRIFLESADVTFPKRVRVTKKSLLVLLQFFKVGPTCSRCWSLFRVGPTYSPDEGLEEFKKKIDNLFFELNQQTPQKKTAFFQRRKKKRTKRPVDWSRTFSYKFKKSRGRDLDDHFFTFFECRPEADGHILYRHGLR